MKEKMEEKVITLSSSEAKNLDDNEYFTDTLMNGMKVEENVKQVGQYL